MGETTGAGKKKLVSRAPRRELRNLSVRQRAFLREKILGSTDKEAAIAAGYATSVAENTKQKIWSKPLVRVEFDRLRRQFSTKDSSA
jgi:phage terminase small subunit